MIRASLAAHNRLLREQQQRRKREATHGAADQDEWTRHIAAQAMLTVPPSPPNAPKIPIQETKSHTQKTEAPKRQSPPHPNTVASINAHIDAAMRSADPNWKPSGQPRSNKKTGIAPQQRPV